jgi:M6 family metalloprotease-like protein
VASVSDVTVLVGGAQVAATSAVSGSSVVLTLASPLDAGSEVTVTATVRDQEGVDTKLVSNAVTNTMASGYAPTLTKGYDDSGFSTPDFGEAPIDHTLFLSSTHVRVVMLFVDFPSHQLAVTPQQMYDAWVPPAVAWFKKASFGRDTLSVDFVDKIYHLPKDDYGQVESGGGGPLKTLIGDAAALADADVDFSKYDAIWVVDQAGYGVRQLRLWPQNALVLDGKPILHAELAEGGLVTAPSEELGHPFTQTGAAHQALTHELGHHMGIPDTSYKPDPNTPYDFTFVGGWDLQDSPAGMLHGGDYFAWTKWRLGWIDPSQIRGLTTPGSLETTLSPVESAGGVKLVAVKTSPTFLYAVEVRRHLGNDAASTCDDGVLVYTVDSTKRNGQGPVHVLPAQASPDASRVSTCGAKYAAPFDLGPGEVSTFEDANVKVEVLSTDGVNYRVRVTRK